MKTAAIKPDAPASEARVRFRRASQVRSLSSVELFGAAGTRELLIEHAGFTYRLSITQSNKLILTK